MIDIQNIVEQHPKSVAQLFSAYGIEKIPTPQNLSAAIIAYKRPFVRDLIAAVYQNEYADYEEYIEELGGRKKKKKLAAPMAGHDAAASRKHSLTGEQKANIAQNVLGGVMGLGTSIAGAVAAAKSNGGSDGSEAVENAPATSFMQSVGAPSAAAASPMKKYLPYILGGVGLVVVVVLGYFVMKKK